MNHLNMPIDLISIYGRLFTEKQMNKNFDIELKTKPYRSN